MGSDKKNDVIKKRRKKCRGFLLTSSDGESAFNQKERLGKKNIFDEKKSIFLLCDSRYEAFS